MEKRRDVGRLQDEIEELFADLWQVPRFSGLRRGFRPQVDCYVTEEPPQLTVVVELPGVEPDEVEIAATARTLVVRGVRRRVRVEGAVFQQMEIEYGPFQREVRLPADVDTSRTTAAYDHGLLTIVLPISRRAAGPVRVAIQSEVSP
jgi:HSP20 family protein